MFASLLRACGAPERASWSCAPSACDAPLRTDAGPLALVAESQEPLLPQKAPSDVLRPTLPAIFTRFQFSVIYTQLGATQGTLMEQQRNMLQSILKHFAKEFTAGVGLTVLCSNGRTMEYVCQLDKKMTQLTMQCSSSKSCESLLFRNIERICSPEEVRNLRASCPLFIDECCTTLVLAGQRFVTFRMESVAAREYLMLCLQVLRMSQDQARMWYA
mmetsp:Transcript_78654/g.218395  ORF Transcript_78654/g.218395 Transcript_78654/m.218395 type:complete len:216 (+) Transcript_78654:84-731(+)|eukprot:CAMPEP_0117515156 /NCGR_PEP_ID=MMETSP0784-20121206/30435_1 /TAXON_ID=39447 /ORGANISM="" /LENGTH=215 /DNA_ID=CAMNT_0005310965 /DNA_START=129 /DNA_END=776 /DNA_ORIENTATION=+